MQTREKAQRMHIVKKVQREIMEYNYTYSEEGAERNEGIHTYSEEGTERNEGIHIVKKAQRKMMEYI